jgi:hypothetical protein
VTLARSRCAELGEDAAYAAEKWGFVYKTGSAFRAKGSSSMGIMNYSLPQRTHSLGGWGAEYIRTIKLI